MSAPGPGWLDEPDQHEEPVRLGQAIDDWAEVDDSYAKWLDRHPLPEPPRPTQADPGPDDRSGMSEYPYPDWRWQADRTEYEREASG